jgi:hypothetical protein
MCQVPYVSDGADNLIDAFERIAKLRQDMAGGYDVPASHEYPTR